MARAGERHGDVFVKLVNAEESYIPPLSQASEYTPNSIRKMKTLSLRNTS